MKKKLNKNPFRQILLLALCATAAALALTLFTVWQEQAHYQTQLMEYGEEQLLLVKKVAKETQTLLESGKLPYDAVELVLKQAPTTGSRTWLFCSTNQIFFQKNDAVTAEVQGRNLEELLAGWEMAGGNRVTELGLQLATNRSGVSIFSPSASASNLVSSWSSFSHGSTRYYVFLNTDEAYIASRENLVLHAFLLIAVSAVLALFSLLMTFFYCQSRVRFFRNVERLEQDCAQKITQNDALGSLLEEERKTAQSASTRDSLTRVYNRRFFDMIMTKLGKESHAFLPACILIFDLNQLNEINENEDFVAGDNRLIKTASIIAEHCGDADLLARTNNSEFTLFLANTPLADATALVTRMEQRFLEEQLSVCYGIAPKLTQEEGIQSVLSQAKLQMNLSKYLTEPSSRHRTLTLLQESLMVRTSETAAHCQSLRALALSVGEDLELNRTQLLRLQLGALLHDMGKIGIPDSILLKNGKLSKEEFLIMRHHAEMGSRIIRALPDLECVSVLVLQHHEKFDGTGYPAGLRGEEIDLLARILAVVDSFDAITSRRIYSDAQSTGFAVQELIAHKGTQYDPRVVESFIHCLIRLHRTNEENVPGLGDSSKL